MLINRAKITLIARFVLENGPDSSSEQQIFFAKPSRWDTSAKTRTPIPCLDAFGLATRTIQASFMRHDNFPRRLTAIRPTH